MTTTQETQDRAWEAIDLLRGGMAWRTGEFEAHWDVSSDRVMQIFAVARDLMEENDIPGAIVNWRAKGPESRDGMGHYWHIEERALEPRTQWHKNTRQRARYGLSHQKNSMRLQQALADTMPESPLKIHLQKVLRFSQICIDMLEDVVTDLETEEIESLFNTEELTTNNTVG